jgi:hypothetical protein
MNKDEMSKELRGFLTLILSMDQDKQREAVSLVYEDGCHLETPYLILKGRDEIIESYLSLSKNNMDLIVDIGSISI